MWLYTLGGGLLEVQADMQRQSEARCTAAPLPVPTMPFDHRPHNSNSEVMLPPMVHIPSSDHRPRNGSRAAVLPSSLPSARARVASF